MPNESIPICGCGAALDVPKGRNGNLVSSKNCGVNIVGKSSSVSKWEIRERKNRPEDRQGPASGHCETGGNCSSVGEQWRTEKQSAKHGRRLNSSRRTRSAERPDTHYTYIDSGSSIVGAGIRDNVIPEALYASINSSPNRIANTTGSLSSNNQGNNGHNHQQQTTPAVYAIPSMTSPPPTYDVAMWQSGLPPSYEEYLCHKYAVISRSHTPPPPWSDSSSLVNNGQQSRRDILASQPDLREYLSQLAKAHAHVQAQTQTQSLQNNNQLTNRQQQRVLRESTNPHTAPNLQVSRDQAVRSQRARTTVSRSQSESRARQQRAATMYEDGAFCMETTAIQSAFEHGVAFCSLM